MIDHSDKHFFWAGPFSQWHACTLKIDEKTFNCAEQAMMYFKAVLFEDPQSAAQILAAHDPGKQKALGRAVRKFDNAIWDRQKLQIVERVNHAKFSQNKGLRRKLFQTGHKYLCEASPVDTIWGIGLDASAAALVPQDQWPGQNLLGKCLTRLRTQLRAEFPDESTETSV